MSTAHPAAPARVRLSPQTPGRVSWLLLLSVALAYAAGSFFAFSVLNAPTAIAVLYPPAGVSLAALVLSPRRWWPAVLAVVFATETSINLYHGQPLSGAVWFGVANTVEPLVGALLVRAAVPGSIDLTGRRDLRVFLLGAVVVGPLVGAIIGATTIAATSSSAWIDALPLFWAGDALAVLTVGGAILTARVVTGDGAPHWGRLVVVLAATAVLTTLSFLPESLPAFYLPIPLLLWISLRYGVPEVAAAGLVFTLTANVVTARGDGPWAHLAGTQRGAAASLQLYLAVAILAAWLLAVLLGERESASRLYEQEHESALQLQRALLPVIPADLPGMQVDALYRPAELTNDVGGDWYDAFELPGGRVGLVVGDVVGHELRAAVTMGRLHTLVRLAAAAPGATPASVLAALDGACEVLPDAVCATVGYAEFDPASGRLRYACAGHPPPYLLNPDGTGAFLEEGRSAPVGVTEAGSPGSARAEAVVDIDPAATLVWYSDGLVERRGEDIDTGLDRLAAAVSAQHAAEALSGWSEEILAAMTDTASLTDDVVVICARPA